MLEIFIQGVLIALTIMFFAFLKRLFRKRYNQTEIKKMEHLEMKFNHLLNNKDGKNINGEDLFVVNIFAELDSRKWKVYKTLKPELVEVKEDICIYEINDDELTSILKKDGLLNENE